jgi:preprotein translocase subunit SecD
MRLSMPASLLIVLHIILVPPGPTAEASDRHVERQTGFYLVRREAPAPEALPAPNADQWVARYDYKFLREEERESPKHLLLGKQPDVPLLLAKPPAKAKGAGGRTELLIELAGDGASSLERVSREHIGEQVAFVINGEVVSTHTIRGVIRGGEFKLSRCTDNACEFIYARLIRPQGAVER